MTYEPKKSIAPLLDKNFSLLCVAKMVKDKHYQTSMKRVREQRAESVEICSLDWNWRIRGLESRSRVYSGKIYLSPVLESSLLGVFTIKVVDWWHVATSSSSDSYHRCSSSGGCGRPHMAGPRGDQDLVLECRALDGSRLSPSARVPNGSPD